jgi:molecular chaperone GrpE
VTAETEGTAAPGEAVLASPALDPASARPGPPASGPAASGPPGPGLPGPGPATPEVAGPSKAPGPEPADGGDGTTAALRELAAGLGRVEEHLGEFHRRSSHRETIIDRLHEENQRLRGGIGRIILEPVVADLIRLYDQLDREAGRAAPGDTAGQLVRSFGEDVAQILDRCGVELFTAEPGDPFERERHRALAVIPCDDPARHNTVADVIAAGFADRDTGRVRRPVQARFYQCLPGRDRAGPATGAAPRSE